MLQYENNGKRNCIRYLRYSLDVMLCKWTNPFLRYLGSRLTAYLMLYSDLCKSLRND